MKNMFKLLTSVFVLFSLMINISFAQNGKTKCITDELFWESVQDDPTILERRNELNAFIENYLKTNKGKEKGDKKRKAMESAEKYLVDYENGLIKLIDPPFCNSKEEPGYIKGYISGLRENGGQYTHGAIWGIIAYIMMDEKEKGYSLMSMINPVNKTKHKKECEIYRKEPYVICADIYSNESNIGLGGWSWYTGSASWYYRLGLEYILGFKVIEGEKITINPKVPDHWKEFKIKYKNAQAVYNISLKKGESYRIQINGEVFKEDYIPLYEKGNYEIVITFS